MAIKKYFEVIYKAMESIVTLYIFVEYIKVTLKHFIVYKTIKIIKL